MNLKELKRDVFTLIEEANKESPWLTDDPDIDAKKIGVFNHIIVEVAKIKKIPRYVELEVETGDVVTFSDLERACGNEVYQIGAINGIGYEPRANGTVFKIKQGGTMCVDLYVYPERITEKTKDTAYELELSPDAVELLPYGIAADLLKSDQSADYGIEYSKRYESMLARLGTNYQIGVIYYDGGVVL